MEIPDDLLCLFSGRVERRDGSVVIDVPADELDHGDIAVGNVYRIAVLSGIEGSGGNRTQTRDEPAREPPVQEGDLRTVEIEGIGDQGDGIAKVDRGYVVIVPGTDVGDEVTVEIESIYPNFAMGRVLDGDEDDDAEDVEAASAADAAADPVGEASDESAPEPETDEESDDPEPEPGLDFGDADTEF